MARIASESEWLACNEPRELYHYARNRIDSQQFRWLAAEWGSRIRAVFEPNDLAWFDTFAQWVAGAGPHPLEVCEQPHFEPLDYPRRETFWARRCADSIRENDPMSAAADAGVAASEHYPFVPLPSPDFAHAHRPRAASKRAVDKAQADAHWQAWHVAKNAHSARVLREFCDQFRDVAGNPFQEVVVRPEWRTAAVVSLANVIAIESAFDRLPILADALQDAGCEDAQIIKHCRSQGSHVRGCWVVELFAKE